MLDNNDEHVHLFIIMDGKVLITQGHFPSSKLKESDGYSAVVTAARITPTFVSSASTRTKTTKPS